MNNPSFSLRGVVEGFYGSFYTFPERNDLIRFLGQNGFNFYMYGPKNDRQHRMRWWDPYPPAILEEFAQSIRIAQQSGVTFCYAISFGVPLNYASREDFEVVTAKLRGFFDLGCRAFGVLLDDLTDGFVHEVSRLTFPNVAHAHADFCNRLYAWARSLDDSCTLYLCPTEYCGRAPFGEYLYDLGKMLHPGIDVFYTGPAICSPEIAVDDIVGFAEAVRRPPLIWDNYPTNDLQARPEMHIGPLQRRDPLLYQASKGFVANVMNQAEASRIPLLTIADYLNDPCGYDPEAAWKRTLLAMAGLESYEALYRFAENSLGSPLQQEQAPEMTRLVSAALASLEAGQNVSISQAVMALSRYLDILDESCYHLKNRMRNLALRYDVLPWIEALEEELWLGRRALKALDAIESGADFQAALGAMQGLVADVERNPKRIGGTSLLALAQYVTQRADAVSTLVQPASFLTPMLSSGRAHISAAAFESTDHVA